MSRSTRRAGAAGIAPLLAPGEPFDLARALPGQGPWEVEIGFGKGRFLLRRAAEEPGRRFLGIELASEYFRLVARRLQRRGLGNVLLLEGEAQYLLGAVLPRGFAERVHVYFPDPWPKTRHQRRRLFSPSSLDLVLGLLAPGGRLDFATDFVSYGEEVRRLLESFPGVRVASPGAAWPEGPRTNYEAKYVSEGRSILRLTVRLEAAPNPHPEGLRGLVAGVGIEDGA